MCDVFELGEFGFCGGDLVSVVMELGPLGWVS